MDAFLFDRHPYCVLCCQMSHLFSVPARFFHQSCSCGRADREAMEVEDSDIGSHEGAWVWTNWQHCHISISLEHRYGSHRKPSEKLDVLKDMTYENWKHCWAITATTQGQSLAGSRPVLERFGKAEGDEMTVQVLGFNISMKNSSHQIGR